MGILAVHITTVKIRDTRANQAALQGGSPFKKVTSEMYHLFFLTLRKWAAKCNCNYFLTLRKWEAALPVEYACSTPHVPHTFKRVNYM